MSDLQQAIDAIDRQIEELEKAKQILKTVGGGGNSAHRYPSKAPATDKPKRNMSPEARARIADAARARHAAAKAAREAESAPSTEASVAEDLAAVRRKRSNKAAPEV